MRHFALLLIAAALLPASDKKPLPGQAGNDDLDLSGDVIVNREEIKDALGIDLGAGYVAVKMKVTPKGDKPLYVSPDDFTLISSKDGQRSQALAPGQIAGKGALIVKAAPEQPGGYGTTTNGPIWGGVRNLGGGSREGADHGVEATEERPSLEKSKKDDNPLMTALKTKQLPEKETKETIEGLLYFPLEGKIQPKDLRVLYKGPAGRLEMDFENPKKKKK